MNETNIASNMACNAIHDRDFELKRNFLYETIVSVLDGEGNPHLAPLGVRVKENLHGDGQWELEARVFSNAAIYSCLKNSGECTVHFPGPSQLDLFFLPFRGILPSIQEKLAVPAMLARGRLVRSPVFKGIANYMEAGVAWVRDELVSDAIAAYNCEKQMRGVFRFASKAIIIGDPRSPPINRQHGLILEFLVKASRLHCFPPNSKEKQANISCLLEIIDKMEDVAPGDEKNMLARTLLESLRHSVGVKT
jgi:hypothetical protein